MSHDVETVIVGAGAVGLATATALATAGQQVLVLEREARSGTETTARNSEVIHAGLYYPQGSLKARLCVAGNRLLRAFCRRNGVPIAMRGKLVVAVEEHELEPLTKLAERARANGVRELRLLDADASRAREPQLRCRAALLSPTTGVVDALAFVAALEGHLDHLAGSLVHQTEVETISRRAQGGFTLEVRSQGALSHLSCRNLVIAAGHGATPLARTLHRDRPELAPDTYPAKGHYFALSGPAPFQHLIYPLPGGAGSLGIHYTMTTAGETKFGPDFEWVTGIDYTFDEQGGRRLQAFERDIRRYWPDLPDGRLSPAYTGVRPKLSRPGEPARDFVIAGEEAHGVPGFIGLYGIDSPGLTSSLAIGSLVARMLARS